MHFYGGSLWKGRRRKTQERTGKRPSCFAHLFHRTAFQIHHNSGNWCGPCFADGAAATAPVQLGSQCRWSKHPGRVSAEGVAVGLFFILIFHHSFGNAAFGSNRWISSDRASEISQIPLLDFIRAASEWIISNLLPYFIGNALQCQEPMEERERARGNLLFDISVKPIEPYLVFFDSMEYGETRK